MKFKHTNLKAFLGQFPLKKLTGHQKFLLVAVHHAGGEIKKKISVSTVRSGWLKSLLRIKYNPSFYSRAQQAGWVDPDRQQSGMFCITDSGLQHMNALVDDSSNLASSSGTSELIIFDKKSAHSFDKFLRGILAGATKKVLLEDTWVDERIFDNVLDVAPKDVSLYIIYAHKNRVFDSRARRFCSEYNCVIKECPDLHDRFLVVDGAGYILGPSMKDAASKSPALVVRLDSRSSVKLSKFFAILWSRAK